MPRFETLALEAARRVIAPDGSVVHELPRLSGGSMSRIRLPRGTVSRAVVHRSVEELWFVVSGRGQMWRREEETVEVVPLAPGVSVTLPVGTWFQFRSGEDVDLVAVAVTMPPWPGPSEAVEVEGPWGSGADSSEVRSPESDSPPGETRLVYSKSFTAGWSDMDFNSHMRNTAFLDRAADVRMMFFAEHGFPMREFVARRLGPVIMRDEVEYFREVSLLQEISVTLAMAGMAPDGSRFLLRNDILHAGGKVCARVTSAGGWLDLGARKLVAPPAELLMVMTSLPRTDDYAELPSSVGDGA